MLLTWACMEELWQWDQTNKNINNNLQTSAMSAVFIHVDVKLSIWRSTSMKQDRCLRRKCCRQIFFSNLLPFSFLLRLKELRLLIVSFWGLWNSHMKLCESIPNNRLLCDISCIIYLVCYQVLLLNDNTKKEILDHPQRSQKLSGPLW